MKKVILTRPGRFSLLIRVIRWHIQFYFGKHYFPLACGIYLTNMCNFRCEMCNIFRNPHLRQIPPDRVRLIIDDLQQLGCYYVSFSGGEPFLYKDIFGILAYAKGKIPYVHVVSNGYLLNEDAIKKLADTRIDEISVSIDGLPETHDRLRGVPGAFDKAVAAINALRAMAPDIDVVVNSIISPMNIKDLYELARFVEELGVKHKFQPINYHPSFEGQEANGSCFEFSRDKLDEVIRLIEFLRKRKNVVNSPYFLSKISDFFNKSTSRGIFKEQCLFGYHHCEIKEDGDLYPCLTGMAWQDGFPIKNSLSTVLRSPEYRKKLESLKDCRLCKTNMYVCYLEPRMTFPLKNYFRFSLFAR